MRIPRFSDFAAEDPLLTAPSSQRVGAVDLDTLDGLVKEFGAVYQAYVSKNLRRHGIDVLHD